MKTESQYADLRMATAEKTVALQPYADLGAAVLEQAVNDYRILQRHGLVEGRRVHADRWPRRAVGERGLVTEPKAVMGISGPRAAYDLINFLTGIGWQAWQNALGFNLDNAQVARELGLA